MPQGQIRIARPAAKGRFKRRRNCGPAGAAGRPERAAAQPEKDFEGEPQAVIAGERRQGVAERHEDASEEASIMLRIVRDQVAPMKTPSMTKASAPGERRQRRPGQIDPRAVPHVRLRRQSKSISAVAGESDDGREHQPDADSPTGGQARRRGRRPAGAARRPRDRQSARRPWRSRRGNSCRP